MLLSQLTPPQFCLDLDPKPKVFGPAHCSIQMPQQSPNYLHKDRKHYDFYDVPAIKNCLVKMFTTVKTGRVNGIEKNAAK